MPFITPFTNAIVPTAGSAERPNLGTMPDKPTAGTTGEPGAVSPGPLPTTSLFMGGPGAHKG